MVPTASQERQNATSNYPMLSNLSRPDVQTAAATTWMRLSTDFAHREAMIAAGAVPAPLGVLKSDQPVVQMLAALGWNYLAGSCQRDSNKFEHCSRCCAFPLLPVKADTNTVVSVCA